VIGRTMESAIQSPVEEKATPNETGHPASGMKVALLTGGMDRPYAFGLSLALASKRIALDVLGAKELDSQEFHAFPNLTFRQTYGDQRRQVGLRKKLSRYLVSYARMICYAATAKPRILHILWNYKFQLFDRTLLMLYYKALGKRIVFTAHNVNAAIRDGNESAWNQWSLKAQYRLVDHIFVHTDKMKDELCRLFGVAERNVSVIPFGVNNSVPDTKLTFADARRTLGVQPAEKTILFFGGIRPYKGLEYLVAAFQAIAPLDKTYRLIIAGEPKKEAVQYWRDIQRTIECGQIREQVLQDIRFLADEETEIYFKAADVVVLPYTQVFQSGVLFLAYNFGLPVIATDVGSLRDDIIQGQTGYICRPCDATDLARAIDAYFKSDLFKTLDQRRAQIRSFARARNSWDVVSDKTCSVYARLMAQGNQRCQ